VRARPKQPADSGYQQQRQTDRRQNACRVDEQADQPENGANDRQLAW
jgi:hypothetical protein